MRGRVASREWVMGEKQRAKIFLTMLLSEQTRLKLLKREIARDFTKVHNLGASNKTVQAKLVNKGRKP